MKTTIQISEDLRQRLKVLAAYRNTSYEQLLNDLVTAYETAIKKMVNKNKNPDMIEHLIVSICDSVKKNTKVKRK